MAVHTHMVDFIKRAEGGYVNDPLDAGGETNKGITYATWKSMFGDQAHDRFLHMSDEDWAVIFKKLYWDPIFGDQIHSQRIADVLVDWVWGSGKHYPELDVQDILIHAFNEHITEDGNFGPATIAAINEVDEQKLYDAIIAKRFDFFKGCVATHPTNARFLRGWNNRLNHLMVFESTGKLV